MASLLSLPHDAIPLIAEELHPQSQINALAQTCHQLHHYLVGHLCRYNNK